MLEAFLGTAPHSHSGALVPFRGPTPVAAHPTPSRNGARTPMKRFLTIAAAAALIIGVSLPAAAINPAGETGDAAVAAPLAAPVAAEQDLALSIAAGVTNARDSFSGEPKPAPPPPPAYWSNVYSGPIPDAWAGGLIWPASPGSLVDGFGPRGGGFHGGIDLFAGYGSTIVAAGAGTVTVVATHWSWGHMVKIDHGSGVQTLYAHMIDGSAMVSPGQWVEAGTPIGLLGETGEAYGAHLHFEVYVDGQKADPLAFLP